MKDLGPANKILGMQIYWDKSKKEDLAFTKELYKKNLVTLLHARL